MSRTTIAMVSGLIVLGCIVAWLPAQESSRRAAPRNRISNPANFAPAAELQSPASPAILGDGLPPTDPAGEPSIGAAEELAANSDIETSQLHSVLKRGKAPAAVQPPTSAATPPSLSQPALRPGELPRRPTMGAPALSPTKSTPPDTVANPNVASSGSIPNVAIGGKSAALKVEIAGPQGLTVGKPAPYVVHVSNESDAPAEEVQLRMALPAWVTVQTTQPTSGEAQFQPDGQGAGRLVWNLPRIAARARESIKLGLVAGEGDAFDLGVEWTCKPAFARAAIMIKQAQLALSLAGPADMTFGEEKQFTLSISNPGSADAERVVVSVTAANSPPQQFEAGTIPAGHKKEVPLAVVASQPGTIEIAISAAAEGGLEAITSGKINVRKAEVSLAIEGPPLKYAGSEATYMVRVANGGTAPADNVNLSLALPGGAKYLGGIDGAASAGGNLKWKIASLPPGGERTYELRVQLNTAGLNRVAVQSQAAASSSASSAAETEVEAVAELKLVVNDPSGPLPTGEQATYEIQVMNRGSQAARQVKVVVQFSEGVEPVAFEGCEGRIVPGQVLCQPLAQLGPGEQATLRVKAKGQQAGTHQFRVEVTTTDGQSRLVSEGTTRFFVDAGRGGAASTARKPSLVPNTSIPSTLR